MTVQFGSGQFAAGAPMRIAVIGAGISGMGAAHYLSRHHQVTLFEAQKRLGGHARTIVAGQRADTPVDTGFIVYNHATYPHLVQLFDELGVPAKRSDMAFAATIDQGRIEYGLRGLSIMAQKRNLARPAFYRMVRDILYFNANALSMGNDPDLTVAQMLDRMGVGDWFRRYYLLPLAGAIWSSTPQEMAGFPAATLTRFFENHSLLTARKSHQWMTVDGGSRVYVDLLRKSLTAAGVDIRQGAPVRQVTRDALGASLRALGGEPERFDKVIFACHSDDAIAMIDAPTPDEQRIVGAVRYQDNTAVLHSDPGQMPRRRACWASWVYRACHAQDEPRIGVTYWMNRLQQLDMSEQFFVSLNPTEAIDERLTWDQTTFRHPVFDKAAIAAQALLPGIQGQNHSYFAGAWTRHGFHEDGLASAAQVASLLTARQAVAA